MANIRVFRLFYHLFLNFLKVAILKLYVDYICIFSDGYFVLLD